MELCFIESADTILDSSRSSYTSSYFTWGEGSKEKTETTYSKVTLKTLRVYVDDLEQYVSLGGRTDSIEISINSKNRENRMDKQDCERVLHPTQEIGDYTGLPFRDYTHISDILPKGCYIPILINDDGVIMEYEYIKIETTETIDGLSLARIVTIKTTNTYTEID